MAASKTESADPSDERLRAVELAVARAEAAVNMAKWIFASSFATVLLAFCGAMWTVVNIQSSVSLEAQRTGTLSQDVWKVERAVEKLADRLDKAAAPKQ